MEPLNHDRTLRFGIIGPGSIANLHAQAIHRADRAELVAVYGRNRSAAGDFAKRHGIRSYDDLDSF